MQSIFRGLKSVVAGRRDGVFGDDEPALREIERYAAKIAKEAGELLRWHFERAAECAVQGRQAIRPRDERRLRVPAAAAG